MKHSFFLITAFLSMSIISCKDNLESISQFQNANITLEEDSLVCYPKRQVMSRSNSAITFENNWEKFDKVLLASGDSVRTPWNKEQTSTEIPVDIRQDITKANGWELIAHTVNGYGEKKSNYLLFHNKYTGILKGFYYLENETSQNTAIWKLHFESPQSLLNFADDYALPASSKGKSDIYLGNITNNESKGFTLGWNCFQTELAYDPNLTSVSLQISPYNMTTSDIELTGNYESSTQGLIISTTSVNPVDGVIKATGNFAGKQAEEWLKGAIKANSFKKIKDGIINTTKDIVTRGVSRLLGKFVGGFFSQTQQSVQTIQLKTEGEVSLSGKLVTTETGIIMPLSIQLSENNVGKLGAWNLSKAPDAIVSPLAIYDGPSGIEEFILVYKLDPTDIDREITPLINPDIVSSVKHYSFNTYLYESTEIQESHALHGGGDHYPYFLSKENLLYDEIYEPIKLPLYVKCLDFQQPPYAVYVPNAPDGRQGANGSFCFTSHYFVCVELTLTIDNNGEENEIVSSHFFRINDYSWRKDEISYINQYWPFNQ